MARLSIFLALIALATAAQTPPEAALRLGADDIITVHVVDVEEISDKPIRIGADGYINLPAAGRIKAAGLTVEELQTEVAGRLKRTIVKPDVTVSVAEIHSHPVSVVGAVKTPGVIQLAGRKTLVEVMLLAGGPRDDAGYTARIMRQQEFGALPLAGAAADETGTYSVAEVNLQRVMDARDPAGNIVIMPNDVISVPKAEMVFVLGDVLKPGGIVMGDQKPVTVLQAISAANGLSKTAKATQAKILRVTPGSTTRSEVPVDLKAMLNGKGADLPMRPDDILFVPNSLRKEMGLKTLEAAAGSGLTSVIYRVP